MKFYQLTHDLIFSIVCITKNYLYVSIFQIKGEIDSPEYAWRIQRGRKTGISGQTRRERIQWSRLLDAIGLRSALPTFHAVAPFHSFVPPGGYGTTHTPQVQTLSSRTICVQPRKPIDGAHSTTRRGKRKTITTAVMTNPRHCRLSVRRRARGSE